MSRAHGCAGATTYRMYGITYRMYSMSRAHGRAGVTSRAHGCAGVTTYRMYGMSRAHGCAGVMYRTYGMSRAHGCAGVTTYRMYSMSRAHGCAGVTMYRMYSMSRAHGCARATTMCNHKGLPLLDPKSNPVPKVVDLYRFEHRDIYERRLPFFIHSIDRWIQYRPRIFRVSIASSSPASLVFLLPHSGHHLDL